MLQRGRMSFALRILVLCVLTAFVLLPEKAAAHFEDPVEISNEMQSQSVVALGLEESDGHCHSGPECSAQAMLQIAQRGYSFAPRAQDVLVAGRLQLLESLLGFDPPPPR